MNEKSRQASRRSWGFTSIEVLAATVLASLLMVTVLGVLAGIAKKEKALELGQLAPGWHDPLVRRLRLDLLSATRFRFEPGRVILEACSDNHANHPTWIPTTIHYFVVGEGQQQMLLRAEYPQVQPAAAGRPEIVCLGVDGIVLSSHAQMPGDDGQILPLVSGVVPSRLRIVLMKEGAAVLDRPVVLY